MSFKNHSIAKEYFASSLFGDLLWKGRKKYHEFPKSMTSYPESKYDNFSSEH